MPAPCMQPHPFLLGQRTGVLGCLIRLKRNPEVLICDVWLDLFLWLYNGSKLGVRCLALERPVESGVHVDVWLVW